MHALIRSRETKTTVSNKLCTNAAIKHTGVIHSYDLLIFFWKFMAAKLNPQCILSPYGCACSKSKKLLILKFFTSWLLKAYVLGC